MMFILDCPTFAVDQTWACQPPEIQPGWSGWVGCDIGCRVCDDQPDQFRFKAVRVHGKRWLLPYEARQGRDAHGLLHDMQAGHPRRVPLDIDYLRSPCWKNDGTECHAGTDVCECHPGESVLSREVEPGVRRCEHGEQVGDVLLGPFPDCLAYSGYKIGANSSTNWIQCRRVDQHGNIATPLSAGRLHQGIFYRMGDSTQGREAGQSGIECVVNMMAECVGRVPQSACDQGYYWVNDPSGGEPPTHYHDDPCRSVFDYCLIDENTAHILDNDLFPSQDKARLAAKNAVLDVIRDPAVVFPNGRNLQQLDYYGAIHGNTSLDYWERGAGVAEGTACDDPAIPVATTFPNSYLKHSRCPVHAELIVVTARIEMSLVPYKVDWAPTPTTPVSEYVRQVYPHARVRISAQCGVRATLPNGECTMIRPWIPAGDPGHTVTLGIVNPGPGDGLGCVALPTVSPNVDEIVYVDSEGRTLSPPLDVEWWGYLGEFSDPPVDDRWVDSNACRAGDSMTAKCLQLADALSGVEIPGWPYLSDSIPDDPNQVYGGRIRLNFRNSAYYACCGRGAA